MIRTAQDMKIERESLNNTQNKVKLEMKNIGSQTKISEVSLDNSIDMDERPSGIEDKVKEMDKSVRENVNI